MRGIRTVTATALLGAALAGCGSDTHFQDRPRPATPIDMSVFVDDARVSVSPAHVGAGPVTMYITNQASRTENVQVLDATGRTVASSGTVNAGQTAQINANLGTGDYQVSVDSRIPVARLSIGAPRPSANNALLQP